jgi:SNF2 family DNA or RNA helicase
VTAASIDCTLVEVAQLTVLRPSVLCIACFLRPTTRSCSFVQCLTTRLQARKYVAGKLQQLAALLARLKANGSRCLIFTQMSKMLDILEAFLNLHGYVYLRLDGSTKPGERQALMTRFNTNEQYFCFILSTRSGGVGINLTGANCVVFYDSDWNPAMDQQAQARFYTILLSYLHDQLAQLCVAATLGKVLQPVRCSKLL